MTISEAGEGARAGLLIVSQDRPERLGRLLERLRPYASAPHAPIVLCRATAPDLAADYRRVRERHHGVRWIETDDALEALRAVVRDADPGARIALLSDADEPDDAVSCDEPDAMATLLADVAARAATPEALPCRLDGRSPDGRGPQLIPRVFHRVWVGGKPMPAEYEAFAATWLEHHPGWELRTWTEQTPPTLRNQAAYDAAPTPAQKADIARCEILLDHGGVYLDVDFECLRSIEPLLGGLEAFACAEDATAVTNAIMGCTPGHPFFRALVDRLPRSVERYRDESISYQSGPGLLTREVALEQSLGGCAPWIFGPDVFYPYHWSEPHRRHERFPDAYAVHHWTGSWTTHVAAPAGTAVARFTIAPDWDAPSAAVAATRAFCELFAPGDAVELAVALPHAPGDEDGELVGALLRAVAENPAAIPDVVVYDFDEVAGLPAHASLLAAAEDVAVGCELADLIASMHAVRRALDGGAPPLVAQDPAIVREGIRARRAHDAETELELPAAVAPDPVVPGVFGAYVGEGRMLVRTTWGGKLFAAAHDLSLTPDLVTEGVYDRPFTNYLLGTLRPGDTAIDVGANIGLFSVLMARLVGAGGQVLAYEAQPDNAALLRDNLAMNYMEWATVIEKAAGEAAGTLPFYAPRRFAGNGSLLPRDAADPVDRLERIDVEVEPLDVHAGRLPRIDLLKIDVEGAEHRVLRGARRLLESGAVRRVAFELVRHHMGDDWTPFCVQLRALRAAGWSFERLDDNGVPFTDELERILEVGWFSQVIMRPPPRSGGD